MRKMLDAIGILMIMLGVSTANDSVAVIIPISLVAVGLILMGFVERSNK